MKRTTRLLLLLFFVVIFSGCQKKAEYSPGLLPSDEGVHDFGDLSQMEDMEHEFTLTNVTEQPIRITKVDASCSCMWKEKSDEALAGSLVDPREKVKVPIRMNTSSRQDNISGKIHITYSRQFENGEDGPPEIVFLMIKGNVIPDYRITPSSVDFGTIDGLSQQQVKRTITIAPETVESIAISNATTSKKTVSAEILCETSSDRMAPCEIEVVLDVSSYKKSQALQGAIHVEVDSEPMPKAMISFHANYVAPLEFQPDAIVIGSDIEGEVAREIQVSSSCPSQIVAIHGEHKRGIVSDFNSEIQEKKHVIRLRIPPCTEEAIDENVVFEIKLFPVVGEVQVRTLSVPVYRFL